jgi:PB1 domain
MNTGDDEGPAWNKFWLSMDHESDSMVSGGGSHRPHTPHRSVLSPDHSRPGFDRGGDSVLPNDSASHHGEDVHSELLEHHHAEDVDAPFAFKFKAPSGRVHRVNVVLSEGITALVASVIDKLGQETEAVGGEPSIEDGKLSSTGFALSYLDNEGDTVSITTDQDLTDAVNQARKLHHEKVDLFVHDPSQPPIPVTVEPQPAVSKPPTPPESVLKERAPKHSEDDEDEEAYSRSSKHPLSQRQPEEQLIAGVPNDLLLPGAIVTLAAVIAGVFILSRPSGR